MVEKNFNEVYKVLKPGGIFKVLLKNDRKQEKDDMLEKWWNGVTYDVEEATKLYSNAGFKLMDIEYVGKRKERFWLWLEK